MRINEYIKEFYPCFKMKINHVITKVTDYSKDVVKGSVFVALSTIESDGFNYISEAIKKGAKTIFVKEGMNFETDKKINVFYVSEPKIDLARLLKLVYFKRYETFPCLIGVTGTAGKTSVTTIIYESLKKLHFDVLLIGSNGNYSFYGEKETYFETNNTTPSITKIYDLMSVHELSYDYVVIEVSSQGLMEGRVLGISFDYSIITCFSSEHLEYHHNIAEYKNAKARLLQNTTKTIIINNQMNEFLFFYGLSTCKKVTYGLNKGDYHADIVSKSSDGSIFLINDCQNKFLVNSSLVAEFNIANILAAYALLKELKIAQGRIIEIFNELKPVSGRMNQFNIANRHVVIDYAHSLQAVEEVLKYLADYKKNRLITVIGCGGNRDQSRRPHVGMMATEYSDMVVFTEDNSRNEDPNTIINEIIAGTDKNNYIIEINRELAIKKAFEMSIPYDTIAILGKGCEKTLEKDVTVAYSDFDVIEKIKEQYYG